MTTNDERLSYTSLGISDKQCKARILKALKTLFDEKDLLKRKLELGIIEPDSAREEQSLTNKKIQEQKEKFVLACHVTADGTPRSIHKHAATSTYPNGYYITKLPDGSKLKIVSREKLFDKLFGYYNDGPRDYSVNSVFYSALHQKEITENPKQKTLEKNVIDYNRLIAPTFKDQDIRTITEITLKQHTQQWVNEKHPKRKEYYAYKGILRLIFDYAFNRTIISSNPVSKLNNKPYMKSCDTRKVKPEEKILSSEEINTIIQEVKRRMEKKRWGSYYINGYAVMFAIETGVRVGELCALKWSDISEDEIHIHSQQLTKKVNGKKVYYYDNHTKNEKGISEDGRYFPLTPKINSILSELRSKQNDIGIKSEFIFCHENGEWIKTDAYTTFLRRLCRSKGFSVTNNHALRMSLNSNVFIPLGMDVAVRASLLGHSIETNLKYYSFARKGYIKEARELLSSQASGAFSTPVVPLKIVSFPKEKPQSANL